MIGSYAVNPEDTAMVRSTLTTAGIVTLMVGLASFEAAAEPSAVPVTIDAPAQCRARA
jgi:hypothetical protein